MKKLLLIFFFSGSLDSFSQSIPVEQMEPNTVQYIKGQNGDGDTIRYNIQLDRKLKAQPDTLRAIVLVTLSPNGIAHSRMGFVVIEQGKRPVYLDCRKQALKLPMVGWGYEEVGQNERVR